jgi:hypothetical protein
VSSEVSVKRPHALAVWMAVLLPLPLVVSFLLPRFMNAPTQPGLSPVFPIEVRRQLLTYHRACQTSADCEAPMGCLAHWRLKAPLCTSSECTTDLDCKEGYACQVLETEGTGPRVRVCLTQGRRKEGEPCSSAPYGQQDACEPGLRCLEGWCGRPCSKEEPTSCPEGFFCADNPVAPACLPTCLGRRCPEGQQCVQFDTRVPQPHTVSACSVVHGTHCQESPCPEGQRCFHQEEPSDRPGEVWMSCVQDCDSGKPACPEGTACDVFFCRELCDPDVADSCGPHRVCARRAPDLPWMCRPDYWTQINGGTPR